MKIKGINDYDIVNYKKPSLFVAFPYCTFKCEKECGMQVCQNSALATASCIDVEYEDILSRYDNSPLTHALVFGGLEPFDSYKDLVGLIKAVRGHTDDDIVIYTGYNAKEIVDLVEPLTEYPNIIIKYGRVIPDDIAHFDDVLGVELASHNQYAKRIS